MIKTDALQRFEKLIQDRMLPENPKNSSFVRLQSFSNSFINYIDHWQEQYQNKENSCQPINESNEHSF